MRKNIKSAIVQSLGLKYSEEEHPSSEFWVVDGGHLLHSTIWDSAATYGDIVDDYVKYVNTHYPGKVTVVFDGYSGSETTKSIEQRRR